MKLLRRLGRCRSALIGLFIAMPLAFMGLLAPWLAVADPTDMNTSAILRAPSAAHPFGTDDFGRDVYSRVLYGIRMSLSVGVAVALATTATGISLGVAAGYYRRLDEVIMRVMDALMSFPSILLALGLIAVLGVNVMNVILALIIQYTPRSVRVVRAEVLAQLQLEYLETARAVGASDGRIILRYLIPGGLPPLIVQQTFTLALAILAEASLSFLGVGMPPEEPTLGGMLSDARTHIQTAPWLFFFPGLVLALLILAFNLLGDGLRDVLDPRMVL